MKTLEEIKHAISEAKEKNLKCWLIGCEESAKVRTELEKRGHFVVSCDLLETRIPGWHYQGDVFDLVNLGWDAALFFPPCTYLSHSGVHWLHKDASRWVKMFDGARFFKKLLMTPIQFVAIENPVMHGYAREIIGENHSQIIQPWMFGHPESKKTCLWLKGFPLLKETNNVKDHFLSLSEKEGNRIHWIGPGKNRARIRSETYQGIASAIAEQYGQFLEAR